MPKKDVKLNRKFNENSIFEIEIEQLFTRISADLLGYSSFYKISE